jgi:hypothetical protein
LVEQMKRNAEVGVAGRSERQVEFESLDVE